MNFGDFDEATAGGTPLSLNDFLAGYRAAGGADSDMRTKIQHLLDTMFPAWTASTPVVAARGTAGTFAATCAMSHMVAGSLVFVQFAVDVTNVGTATGFKVPIPFNSINGGVTNRGPRLYGCRPDESEACMFGLGDNTAVYNINPSTGAELAPTLGKWFYHGFYRRAIP